MEHFGEVELPDESRFLRVVEAGADAFEGFVLRGGAQLAGVAGLRGDEGDFLEAVVELGDAAGGRFVERETFIERGALVVVESLAGVEGEELGDARAGDPLTPALAPVRRGRGRRSEARPTTHSRPPATLSRSRGRGNCRMNVPPGFPACRSRKWRNR